MSLGRTAAATAALIGATAIWGSTFVVTKRSLAEMAPPLFLAWRFGLAAAVLLVVRPRSLRRLSARDRWHGLVLGVLLSAGFLLQTFGLEHTSAGLSGFLTGTAVIMTPVVAAVVFGERVGAAGWGAVLLAAVGVVLLAGGGDLHITPGALLTVGGALCFAGHISGLSQWATAANAYPLTAWSVTVAAAGCWCAVSIGSGPALPPTPAAWTSVLYLALGATCLGFVIQAWAQSALTAAAAAVVMTMEPVFAALLGVMSGEAMLPVMWAGGVLIVSSMLVAELGPRRCCDVLSPRVECC
ncbi:MAG TPA: DMT family transporter [Microlunatus sp.]|nr:DMT family transporter [Microlunatus sp.]